MTMLVEPQFGDGSVAEAMLVGKPGEAIVNLRDVPLEALHPTAGSIVGDNYILEAERKFVQKMRETWKA
ncbi:hypothetical protein MN608_00330 [Microdochium nivale]|nr:hypothetical protein MN608_00330 [Microdochium nivale]